MNAEGNRYTALAQVYDVFMDNVDYDAWCKVIREKLYLHGIRDGLICDLCCGTGEVTERLSEMGYDMIGVDASVDMLGIAQRKQFRRAARRGEAAGSDILYLNQDVRAFELYGTVRAIVCTCDSINYITEREDLLAVFRLVNNYLDPGGLFLFDSNLPEKYETIGNQVIAENRREGSFIWQNQYDPTARKNEYDLTIFLPERNGLYSKHEETHVQRAWTVEELENTLEEAGLQVMESCAAYGGGDRGRWFIVAREQGKQERKEQS